MLRLSRGMAYKNAVAGLDHGGGKAVIIGDPGTDKSAGAAAGLRPVRARASAAATSRPATSAPTSRTWTSSARRPRFVTGRSEADGGAGDSSVLTAYGVFQGMRASAEHGWGSPTLAGRTVGVAGVGKVGRLLTGAPDRGRRPRRGHRRQRAGGGGAARDLPAGGRGTGRRGARQGDLDVYAPCALGGALDGSTVESLSAAIVCGAANNQLADESEHGTATRLMERGITYAPDFLVNAGGVIQVSDELHGFSFERARSKTARIFDDTGAVLRLAAERGISPAVAADRIAEERMASVGNPGRIWLPSR